MILYYNDELNPSVLNDKFERLLLVPHVSAQITRVLAAWPRWRWAGSGCSWSQGTGNVGAGRHLSCLAQAKRSAYSRTTSFGGFLFQSWSVCFTQSLRASQFIFALDAVCQHSTITSFSFWDHTCNAELNGSQALKFLRSFISDLSAPNHPPSTTLLFLSLESMSTLPALHWFRAP